LDLPELVVDPELHVFPLFAGDVPECERPREFGFDERLQIAAERLVVEIGVGEHVPVARCGDALLGGRPRRELPSGLFVLLFALFLAHALTGSLTVFLPDFRADH